MRERPASYEAYVGLPDLLGLAVPQGPVGNPAVWASERFFIVGHQTSELWASQFLVDLVRSRALATARDWGALAGSLARALAIVGLMEATLASFDHLDSAQFLAFRPYLGSLSAAESQQFQEILLGRRHPALAAVLARLDEAPGDPAALVTCRELAGRIEEGIARWREIHIGVARRMIGGAPGTGGTSGVAYLERRASDARPSFVPEPGG